MVLIILKQMAFKNGTDNLIFKIINILLIVIGSLFCSCPKLKQGGGNPTGLTQYTVLLLLPHPCLKYYKKYWEINQYVLMKEQNHISPFKYTWAVPIILILIFVKNNIMPRIACCNRSVSIHTNWTLFMQCFYSAASVQSPMPSHSLVLPLSWICQSESIKDHTVNGMR